MARVPNKRQQEIRTARAVGHKKRQNERKKARKAAERMATDPSYKPGHPERQHCMFRRHRQLRRWCQTLMDRRDPERPKGRHDHDAFMNLTRLRTGEELLDALKQDSVSQVVKDLFARAFRERAEAAGAHQEGTMEVDVEDWWGKGPEMTRPGGEAVVQVEERGQGTSNAEEEKVGGGVNDGEGMDLEDREALGGVVMHLPIRTK